MLLNYKPIIGMLEDITLYEFNSLAEFEKAECLWEYGVHVSERFDDTYGYILYQINNFYVEAKYDCQNNTIVKFTSFSTTTKLEPYLSDIDINDLNRHSE